MKPPCRLIIAVSMATIMLAAGDDNRLVVPRLHKMAAKGDINEVKRLLDSGLSPDQERDSFGATALLFAADADMTALLLEHGANPNIRCKDGTSALMEAARNGDIAQAKLLMHAGLTVTDKDHHGRTPLHFSIGNMNSAFTEFLLTSGADINAQDSDGETALMKAMSYAEVDQVKALLKHNANVELKDSKGGTALDRLKSPNPAADPRDISEIRKLINKAQRAGAANPHAFGTSGISAAEQPRMPEASGDT